MSAVEAAEKWGISDRRVRVLCENGKIPGAFKDGKSYKIPDNAVKSPDGRERITRHSGNRFIKWGKDVIGVISTDNAVNFKHPKYNEVIALYTHGSDSWTSEQFTGFLSERMVSRDRRDIERILFRCGLSRYDVLRIAEITRGIHPKDMLWIANSESEHFEDVITDVFDSVFSQRVDLTGDSVDTPEGYNIKRYGVFEGQYGIYKKRISPLATDVESEVAVYLLAQKLGVPCCPTYRAEEDTVFSVFLFDFSKEYLVHFRRLFDGSRSDNEYQNLISARPKFRDDISRMILLDFITRQDDRHLSNIAIKMSGGKEYFYPLYDNGRSLFYEDTEEMVKKACADPVNYATAFGYSGTYWDYVREIAEERGGLGGLINLDLKESEVKTILKESGFESYRLEGARSWILRTLEMIEDLI